ncbi:MAG: ATP-binding protein, partial [Spirochaetes bacterium]|nr:ATP-binding protein [Spirochaetota bacterium]
MEKIITINLIPSINLLYPVQVLSEAVMLEAGAGGVRDDCTTYNFVLAVEEILTNVIRHGVPKKKDLFHIRIEFIIKNKKVIARIYDDGAKYSPPAEYDEDYVLKNFSGMGLHFVRSVIDEYDYRYDDEKKQNVV